MRHLLDQERPGSSRSPMQKRVCFFSNESIEQLRKEQYSIQDIAILEELGYTVTIATSFREIPFGCDLYFSWWASGSILPLIKAHLSRRPIVVVAGGNEGMRYRDSVTNAPVGYLATPWYKKLATLVCLRRADAVLVVSKFMVEDVTRLGARAPVVVHNSIDTTAFSLSSEPRSLVTSIFNLDETVVRIKRGEVFIRSIPAVLEAFPDQQFAIIGAKKDAYPRLEALTRSLGVASHVNFVGSIENSEVVRWMQRSMAYVQISDTETFGVAIAEAMSCGTPVVVSRRGAIPELVADCGQYVDQNDPAAVAAGIISVLQRPADEARSIGLAARRRVETYFSRDTRKQNIQRVISALDARTAPA